MASTCILCVVVCCVGIASSTIDLHYSVTEEGGANVTICNTAEDADLADLVSSPEEFQALRYSLLKNGNPVAALFSVDEETGILRTSVSLDRDDICAYLSTDCYLNVIVVAQSSFGNFFKIQVQILLIDINDNTPKFLQDVVSLSVSEETENSSSFALDGAQDPDSEEYTIQSYSINSNDSPFVAKSDTFADGRSMLRLIVTQPLDREKKDSYMLHILAYDGGQPPNIGSLMVNITITDVNEFPPNFTHLIYNVTINEDHIVNTTVSTVLAIDPDGGENGEVQYSLSSLQSSEILERFRINPKTGDVILQKSLMADSKDIYRVIVEASDKAKQPMMSQAQVFIKVVDNHNNVPTIQVDLLSNTNFAEISEHASQGAAVALVAVTDTDTGANGLVVCDVISDNFRIQKYEGMEYKVVVYTSLNREITSEYNVTVKCEDAGSPPKHAYSSFTVLVLDENDNSPRFTQQNYYASLNENNEIGASAITVHASDIDKGTNAIITYALSPANNQNFSIDPDSGRITVHFALNREVQSLYSFQVLAIDRGSPPLTGTAVVNVRVNDENDNAPKFAEDHFTFYVEENQANYTIVGTVSAYDIDLGDNGRIEYTFSSMTNAPLPFWFMENGSIRTTSSLDRELSPQYSVMVTARDHGDPPLQGSAIVTIKVKDENDNIPVITFPAEGNNSVSIGYDTPVNKVIASIIAYDNDSEQNSKLSFYTRNVSEYFLLNSFSGEIYLVKQLDLSDMGSYSFEVLVQDGGPVPLHSIQTMTIYITDKVTTGLVSKHVVIVIIISVVTIFLAVSCVFAIYLVRRHDQRKQDNFNKHVDESFSDKTTQDEVEAGFGDVTLDSNSNVYCPQTFGVVGIPKRPMLIDRSISLQTPLSSSAHPSDSPIWETSTGEINDDERHRNQLINLQYQQSLLRIQSGKRSNSVKTQPCQRSNSNMTI